MGDVRSEPFEFVAYELEGLFFPFQLGILNAGNLRLDLILRLTASLQKVTHVFERTFNAVERRLGAAHEVSF